MTGIGVFRLGREILKMKDEERTKRQLVDELEEMRRRVAELEVQCLSGKQAGKREEEALQESKRCYHWLAENMMDVVWAMDMHLRFTRVSPSVTRLLGYSVEEAVGRTLEEVLTPASLEVARKALVEELGEKSTEQKDLSQASALELEFNRKDGSTIWTEVKMTCLRDWDGWPVGILGVTRDITACKRREEERLKVEKQESLGIFAGGIAHDFNNILSAILGNISLAKLAVNLEDKVSERLTGAEKACLQARDLTQRLFAVSNREAPLKEVVSIVELLRNSVNVALKGSKVRCEFSLPDDLWLTDVNQGQMEQAIQNLVLHMKQSMLEEGTIRIRGENVVVGEEMRLPLQPGRYVKVSVEEEGEGIPGEHLGRIFDPYYAMEQRGDGLRLAAFYSIVKNHDGHVAVKSQPMVGTTFYMYLAASASQKAIPTEKKGEERPVAQARPAVVQRDKRKVLVMDDEETVRDVAGRMLEHLGYEVEFAIDGTEALRKYQDSKESGEPFDVVIVDLIIYGGMGGEVAIKKLLEIDPEAKAIVSSGSREPAMTDFRRYGFRDAIAKPYEIAELSEVVHKVITGMSE